MASAKLKKEYWAYTLTPMCIITSVKAKKGGREKDRVADLEKTSFQGHEFSKMSINQRAGASSRGSDSFLQSDKQHKLRKKAMSSAR